MLATTTMDAIATMVRNRPAAALDAATAGLDAGTPQRVPLAYTDNDDATDYSGRPCHVRLNADSHGWTARIVHVSWADYTATVDISGRVIDVDVDDVSVWTR